MRTLAALLLALALAGAAAVAAPGAEAAKRHGKAAKKLRLVAFDDCAGLVSYARRHAPRVERHHSPFAPPPSDPIAAPPPLPPPGSGAGPGGGGPQPVPAAPTGGERGDSSGTNVQEQGVDEPDAVKTDGDTIFVVANGDLHAVDARAAAPRLLSSIDVGGHGHELLVRGETLLVLSRHHTQDAGGYLRPATEITEVDVSDPSAMRPVRTQLVDGSYVTGRLTGDTARIVLASPPAAFAPGAPRSAERRVAGWVPRIASIDRRTGRSSLRRVARCRAVRRPRTFAGLDMVTVLTIDLSRGLPAVDADSLMTSVEDVYASKSSLYVATRRWTPPLSPDAPPPRVTTAIHSFDTAEPDRTTYRSSGGVPGYILNSWAMSEHRGVLRVASTDDPEAWDGASQSFVTTLADRGGALVKLGAVGGLGRGERVFGVRFMGDAGYVVTFRQTDPLYTIDLSAPATPRVLGELKILGYSAYLHPIGRDLLLGVGQDATEDGRRTGAQLSVFDVSDLRDPRRVQQRLLEQNSSSLAEFDHHAFLYWRPRGLAVIPLRRYDYPEPPFLGAAGFRVGAAGIDEVGRVSHDWNDRLATVERSVVVGDRLFTVSGIGVKASDMGTFSDLARVDFPLPPAPEYPDYGGPRPSEPVVAP